MASGYSLGILVHALGGVSASTCYLPQKRIKNWKWETYWITQSFFAWFFFPLLIGVISVPQFFQVLQNSPMSLILTVFLLGAVYGFGGLAFGLAINEIGFSLTYTISIGISAIAGTLVPMLIKGQFLEQFSTPSGIILLVGILVSILGIMFCGIAGFKKEKQLSVAYKNVSFNFRKGFFLTLLAGMLSAIFGVALSMAEPITVLANELGNSRFAGNIGLFIACSGAFITNALWFGVKGLKENYFSELYNYKIAGFNNWIKNILLSISTGGLWYLQFFFYGLGHIKLGPLGYSSWVIHMSMLVFFSFLVGLILSEWALVETRTKIFLYIGLIILILSFIIITYSTTLV